MNKATGFFKELIPPVLLKIIREYSGIRLTGKFSNWKEARSKCSGYDSRVILEKVLSATQQVKRGEAIFERDSVIFDQIEYSWPVTATLMWVAAKNSGSLNVMDFGGSLGSIYFQNKKFLNALEKVRWHVVEQEHYVSVGKEYIADDRISFYSSIDQSINENQPDVCLLSSVLQYLPNPQSILSILANYSVPLILIDRTPFLFKSSKSMIKKQCMPKNFYKASYPCHLFNEQELLYPLSETGYTVVERFDSIDDLSSKASWSGIILQKTS